jgi:GT2 family glycosyltransferase
MKLSIIIVSWNVQQDLVRCLRSIEENRPCAEYETIVVDNASSDGTVDRIRHVFPDLAVVANKENRGFAAANNQGIKKSQGRYLFLLNPDTIVHPHSLDALVEFMDKNGDVGACGPKLLNEDGTIQPSTRHFPTFRGALYRHTAFRFLRIFRGEYDKFLMKAFEYDRQMDVDEVTGAALMVRRSAIEQVGDMDESFFMYYEEVDLCYRTKQAGWRIVFIPGPVITHLGGRSANQISVLSRVMMLTSLLTFFRKHRGKITTATFNCVFKPAVILGNIFTIAFGIITYIFAVVALSKRTRNKTAARVKNSAIMLWKYSWQLLFRI